MKDSSKYYLTDHYSWVKTETGTFVRAHETADGLVYSVLSQDKHTLLEGNASRYSFCDVYLSYAVPKFMGLYWHQYYSPGDTS